MEEVDIKISVANEIEIPGEYILKLWAELQENLGMKEAVTVFTNSKIFIYKSCEDYRIMLIPACDCDNCTALAEVIKEAVRTGELSTEGIHQLLEKIMNNLN